MLGLVAMWISSKFEDSFPICLYEIYYDAGHKKYKQSSLKRMEIEVLRIVGYKIFDRVVYDESYALMK